MSSSKRRIAAALLLATVSLAAVSAPAMAQASQDTLGDAVASAISNNPQLMAERQTRAVANETLKQAQAGMLPSVSLNGSVNTQQLTFGRTFTTPSGTFPLDGQQERAQVGLEARQSLWSGGTLTARKRQAQAGVTTAEAELRGVEQQIILSVVSAYMDVRRAEEEVRIRERDVDSLRQQVQAARDRFSAGDVTRTDVAQAESRAAGSVGALAASRARLAAARAEYERVVGRPPVQLATPPVAPQLPGTLQEATEEARAANPAVTAARAREEAALRGIDAAKGDLMPSLDIVGSAGMIETYQDRTFRDTNVGIGAQVRVPLYEGGLLSSKTRQARLESDRARYERMAAEREAAANATAAWHEVIAAREAVTASRSRVAAAELAREGTVQELAVGERTTLDVLDQERELLEAQLDLVDSERAAYLAAHRLLAATGRLRPGTIGR
jgi:outer membrane protein